MRQSKTIGSAAQSCILFLLFFVALLAVHAGLLRLPYFWDEAGYYVPAAHDLLLRGSLIPYSTPSNAHPPLVLGYLALTWKLFGCSILVTRLSMLVVSAFALLGIFRLARTIVNAEVATAATICIAMYPVFFTQSSLAQVDLAAAGLTFWGLLAYIEKRRPAMAVWFSLAVLAKETALLTPLALFAWEVIHYFVSGRSRRDHSQNSVKVSQFGFVAPLLIPILPLGLWYLYHYLHTGFVFGNPQYFQYNVQGTLHPPRIFLVLLMRLWQVFGYFGLWLLTVAAVMAMFRPPLKEIHGERPRIALEIQYAFCSVVITYVIAMSFLGGAVLARYMLPAVPLVVIVFVSTLWRRLQFWPLVLAMVVFIFALGLYRNPKYGFSLEDNLAYRDYIVLHEDASAFLQSRYPSASVLTAWPESDELARPYLGYVTHPFRIIRIDNFSRENLGAVGGNFNFDVAVVFSTKYQPLHPMLEHWRRWQEIKMRYFDYHRDLPPAIAAELLKGELVFDEHRDGQWIGIIQLRRSREALLFDKSPSSPASDGRNASSR